LNDDQLYERSLVAEPRKWNIRKIK